MAKVISTPQAFKQKDMTRAIKAAAAAGAKSVRFMVGKLTMEVPINSDAGPPAPSNDWAEVLQDAPDEKRPA